MGRHRPLRAPTSMNSAHNLTQKGRNFGSSRCKKDISQTSETPLAPMLNF
uniref:Uncharacterized protein n=1 Tax=Arundo donax TaxID=35708 RepID=A0A0A9CHN7_ARUDO